MRLDSPIVTYDHNLLRNSHNVKQAIQIVTQSFPRVLAHILGLRRSSVPQGGGADDAVPSRGEFKNLVAVTIPEVRESVEEENGGSVCYGAFPVDGRLIDEVVCVSRS